jgi:hypothetical protein
MLDPGHGETAARVQREKVMAEIEGILNELRHRIMGQFESEPPKPAIQEVDDPARHSALVALRRLSHPARDGVALGDAPASEPISSGHGDGAVEGGDPISPLIRRLSRDMPELLEEIVALVERRTAELNDGEGGPTPRPTERVAAAAFMRAAPTPQENDAGKTAVTLLFDKRVLALIDADAKRLGISRTAWLHVAAGEWLDDR